MNVRTAIMALGIVVTGSLSLAGCSETVTNMDNSTLEIGDNLEVHHLDDGLLLFTRNTLPGANMDALFQGTVTADEAGCLRLETEGDYGVTAVWPKDYGIQTAAGATFIVDADGHVVGQLGEDFTLAGGEVDSLLDSLGFTDADRRLAEERCPGKYWVVAG